MRTRSFLIVAAALGCGAGSDSTPPVTPPQSAQAVATVAMTSPVPDSLFSISDSVTVSAEARAASGSVVSDATISWTSSDAAVASVSPSSGPSTTIVALRGGSATITARAGTATATKSIVVFQRVTRVVANPATITVAVGATTPLSATPVDARGNAVTGLPAATYVSSDATKAQVSAAGVVTGVAPGTATVTVSVQTPGGVVTTAVAVTVGFPAFAEMKVEDFQFNPLTVDVAAGGQVRWTWMGSASHSVTSTGSGPLGSPTQQSGTYTFTFPTAGRYDFYCTVHPFMTGTVIVH